MEGKKKGGKEGRWVGEKEIRNRKEEEI
jgi:hypothetical protein